MRLSTYSFRHEQKGEVIGLKRLRAFTMPDMHSLCTDMPEALKCFEEQLAMGWQTGRRLWTELVAAFRCTKDFYARARSMGKEDRHGLRLPDADRDPLRPGPLLGRKDRPCSHRRADAADREPDRPDRCREFNPVQYQVPQGDGSVVHPPILHCSPTGSVERVICAILENISTQKVPALPTWLSPVQVRVVPVAERHAAFADRDLRCNQHRPDPVRSR